VKGFRSFLQNNKWEVCRWTILQRGKLSSEWSVAVNAAKIGKSGDGRKLNFPLFWTPLPLQQKWEGWPMPAGLDLPC